MNKGFNTYRILAVPKSFNGIMDLRPYMYNEITNNKINSNTCFLFDGVSTTQDISRSLRGFTLNVGNYKFCQFEPIEEGKYKGYYPIIPNFVKIKNIIGRSIPTFEIENVKYKDLPISQEEKNFFIREKYLTPIIKELNLNKSNANDLMYKEWKGDKITQLEKNNIVKKIDELNSQIKKFNPKDYEEKLFETEF